MTDNLFYVLIFLCTLFFLQPYFLNSYAEEPILISISSGLENIIFDGKWSNNIEWKHSSYNYFEYEDGTKIHLRTAHQGNFIYVHINVATDMIINKGIDSAIVCFDTKNDKTVIPSSDDYCFSTAINRKNSFTYQGGSFLAINGHFKKIPNHKDFIAVGSANDVSKTRIQAIFTYTGSQVGNLIEEAGLFNQSSTSTDSVFAMKNFPSDVAMNNGDILTVNWEISISGSDGIGP